MIPRHVETEAEIMARLPKAIERQFDCDLIEQGLQERPGHCRECVFDFDDGIRMVVSRDRKDMLMALHFSFSATNKWIQVNGIKNQEEFKHALMEHGAKLAGRLAYVLGNRENKADVLLSPKGVVHVMFADS